MPETTRPHRRRRRVALVAAAVVAVLVAAGGVAIAVLGRAGGPPVATALPVAGVVAVHDPALVAGAGGEPWSGFSTGVARATAGACRATSAEMRST